MSEYKVWNEKPQKSASDPTKCTLCGKPFEPNEKRNHGCCIRCWNDCHD